MQKLKTEWLNSWESKLCPETSQWVFGVCDKREGIVHVYLDTILKAFNINGFEPVEEWFTEQCTDHLIHELIHYHAPDWTEDQVAKATSMLMSSSYAKASNLTVYIGNRRLTYLLTEDNKVLKVKN